jgi:hypothetical protein
MKWEVKYVCMVHNMLMEFYDLSGLSLNPDKSDIYLNGILDGIRE